MIDQLDLLDVPETPSPRLAWMSKHDIQTKEHTYDDAGDGAFWCAWKEDPHGPPKASADTEIGAISALAARLGLRLWDEPVGPPADRPPRLSRKQAAILRHLKWLETSRGQITIAKAVELVGRDIYANREFHVGNVLRNMVKRGLLVRVKRGTYALAEKGGAS